MALAALTPACESKASVRPVGRTLHLVDVENLLGGPVFTEDEASRVAAEYRVVAGVGPVDFTVVASSHYAAPATWFGWPAARRLVRSGPDGADLALVDVMVSEDLFRRFDRVVVASGDAIFSNPSAWLQQMGCAVSVVCRPGALSRRLAFAVRDVRFLSGPTAGPGLAILERAA